MKTAQTKRDKRMRRHARIRTEIKGTSARPRLSIFRSNRYIWAQLIDDAGQKTIASVTDWSKEIKGKKAAKKEGRMVRAERVGEEVGKIAKEKNISAFVFDRGGNKYHGRVKAVAEGARKAGVQF